MRTTPRRTRWAKERLGLVGRRTFPPGLVVILEEPLRRGDPLMEEAQAFLDAHADQETLRMPWHQDFGDEPTEDMGR